MADALYSFFRGGSGFTLVILGFAMVMAPQKNPLSRSYGWLNLAAGLAFCLSALDPFMRLQVDLGNFILANLMLIIGQSSFVLCIQLLGGQTHQGQARRLFLLGFIWSQLVWLLPLGDYLLNLPTVHASVEDGHSLGPLHAFAALADVAWPLAMFAYILFVSRGYLRGLRASLLGAFPFLLLVILAMGSVAGQMMGLFLESEGLYKISCCLCQAMALGWYLLSVRYPLAFAQFRHKLRKSPDPKRSVLTPGESQIITQRLDQVVATQGLCHPELNLTQLSSWVKVPPYRLSCYFREQLDTTFPTWLNAQRIDWVCEKLKRQPDSNLLELSLAAGYNSKSSFYTQFIRVKGMKPSDYAKTAALEHQGPPAQVRQDPSG